MDAISMLKNDHRSVERLFKRFEKAGERAYVEKRELVDRMIEELSTHAAIEEQLFYPVARATVPKTESIALESLEEHHVVKWLLSELQSMDAHAERFDAKVSVLIENVRHHVKEEEGTFFPMMRDALGRSALGALGDAMESARKFAPTHPHPRAADTPPGNRVAGAAAGVADRVGDTVSGLAQGGVTAIGDVIAAVTRRQRPRVSPRGSKQARRTATKVRSRSSDATDSAIETVLEAKRTGERTVRRARATGASTSEGAKRTTRAASRGARSTTRAATSGMKATATSARRSGKRTATTAKRGATTTRRTASKAAKRTATTARRSVAKTASSGRRSTRAR
jgi:hemerythrin superfamily protein